MFDVDDAAVFNGVFGLSSILESEFVRDLRF